VGLEGGPIWTEQLLRRAGLTNPSGVALDAAGTLHVTDYYNNRVVKLLAGSSKTQDGLRPVKGSTSWMVPSTSAT
jgi:hypothetical protein